MAPRPALTDTPAPSCDDVRAFGVTAARAIPADAAALAAHLAGCAACRVEVAHARALRERLRRLPATPGASPALRRRVRGLLQRRRP